MTSSGGHCTAYGSGQGDTAHSGGRSRKPPTSAMRPSELSVKMLSPRFEDDGRALSYRILGAHIRSAYSVLPRRKSCRTQHSPVHVDNTDTNILERWRGIPATTGHAGCICRTRIIPFSPNCSRDYLFSNDKTSFGMIRATRSVGNDKALQIWIGDYRGCMFHGYQRRT